MAPRIRVKISNLTLEQLRRAARGDKVREAMDEQELLRTFAAEMAAGVYALEHGYSAFQVQEMARLAEALRSEMALLVFVRSYLSVAHNVLGVTNPDRVIEQANKLGLVMMVLHQHFFPAETLKRVAA